MDLTEKNIIIKFLESLSTTESPVVENSKESYVSEPDEYTEKLKKRAAALLEKNQFVTGDVVIWKDGLKNKRSPAYGQPSIILMLHEPALEDKDDASFTETLDIQLGFITESDEFVTFNYDSNRFKKFK